MQTSEFQAKDNLEIHFGKIIQNTNISNMLIQESNHLTLKNNNQYYLDQDIFFSCFLHEKYLFKDENLRGKNLILVSSGKFHRVPLLNTIQQIKNFSIFCLTLPINTWAKSQVDELVFCDTDSDSKDNFEAVLQMIKDYSKNNNISFDGIMTYDDYCVFLTLKLAKAMNLRSLDIDVAKLIKNKYEFRNILKLKGVDYPIYYSFCNHELLKKITDYQVDLKIQEGKEYIIKDCLGAGKNFVRSFSSYQKLKTIAEEIITNEKFCKKDFVIEEYFEGLEIDIDMVIQDNAIKFFSISDNKPVDKNFFKEKGGCTPSKYLTNDEFYQIKSHTLRIINALDINNICLHFEAKCKPKSVYGEYEISIPFFPIEINLRIGGSEVFGMNLICYKYHLFYNSIKVALGTEIPYHKNENDPDVYCSSINFHAERSGIIKEIFFDKDFFTDENLVQISLFKKIGDVVDIENNPGSSFLGFMIAKSNKNVDDSQNNLEILAKRITFVLE